jgi:hypothetical protein
VAVRRLPLRAGARRLGGYAPREPLLFCRGPMTSVGTAQGRTCGKMGPLPFAPYGFGELRRLGFKNSPVKPPPLPSLQLKCLEVSARILKRGPLEAHHSSFGGRPGGANFIPLRSAANRNRLAFRRRALHVRSLTQLGTARVSVRIPTADIAGTAADECRRGDR